MQAQHERDTKTNTFLHFFLLCVIKYAKTYIIHLIHVNYFNVEHTADSTTEHHTEEEMIVDKNVTTNKKQIFNALKESI